MGAYNETLENNLVEFARSILFFYKDNAACHRINIRKNQLYDKNMKMLARFVNILI